MIPELDADGGGAMLADDYDAAAIHNMWLEMSAGLPPTPMESKWHAAPTEPHPDAGDIVWCWENPTAWDILDGDVDRSQFMARVVASTMAGLWR